MNLLEEQQYEYHPRDQRSVFLDVHLNVYILCSWKLSVRKGVTQDESVNSSSDCNHERAQPLTTPSKVESPASRPSREAAVKAMNWMKTALQDEL